MWRGVGRFAHLSVCSCKWIKKEEEKKKKNCTCFSMTAMVGQEMKTGTLPVSFTGFDHYLDAVSSVGQHRQQEKAREAISTTNDYFWLFDDFRSEATSKHVKDSKERNLL